MGVVVSKHDSNSSRHSSPSKTSSEIESESPCEGDLLMIRRMLGTIPKSLDEDFSHPLSYQQQVMFLDY